MIRHPIGLRNLGLGGICACGLLVAACRSPAPPARSTATPIPFPAIAVTPQNPDHCVAEFDAERDYFPDKAVPRFATGFTIDYLGSSKLVTVSLPGSGIRYRYLLVQCGTPRPSGYDDVDLTVEVPIRTVVTTSTTELPHLVALGLVDRLVGHLEFDYVVSPAIRRRIERGEIRDVGHAIQLEPEVVLDIHPDLVLATAFEEAGLERLTKLRTAGVAVAQVPSFFETSPLGRAEWMLYTAAFFNAEATATGILDHIAQRYFELAERGRRAARGPAVLTAAPLGDTWYMPGGRSFMARLVTDAGGRYLWRDDPSPGSLPLALETVFERALEADFWLHPGAAASRAELAELDPRLVELPVFEHRQIWANDARTNAVGGNAVGGNDYWETGTARPDLVLADLLKIFQPELIPEHELIFHRRLDG